MKNADARRSRVGLLLVVAVAVGIAVRIIFASGYVGYDDYHYIEGAYRISIGHAADVNGHFGTRTGLVVPTAGLFAVFGVGVPTAVAVPFACSVAALFAVFFIGRALFDDMTGAIAALLLAMFPLDVIFAACLSPTAPIGLFAGAAICLFVLGERSRRPWIFAAAGISLGVAFSFGETPLLVFVAYAVYAATLRRPSRSPSAGTRSPTTDHRSPTTDPRRAHLGALIGFGLIVALEMTTSALVYGDPAARFSALAQSTTVRGINPDVAEAGWTLEWLLHPMLRIVSEQELGLFLVLGLPLALWRLVKSDSHRERTLALFVVVLFAWISYGTVSPFYYAPLARLPRYFSLFQIPLVLLLALWVRRMKARAAYAVIVLLAVTSLAGIVLDGSRSRASVHAQVQALIARDRPARVVVDERVLTPFLFFQGFDPPMPVAVLLGDAGSPRVVELDGARPSERAASLAMPGTYVIAADRALQEWLGGRENLESIARLRPADTPYRRLLRSERFRALLGLTRSRYRMEGLKEEAAGASDIVVYSPPRRADPRM